MRRELAVLVGVCGALALLVGLPHAGSSADRKKPAKAAKEPEKFKAVFEKKFPTKPLPAQASVRWAHSPFAHGDCSICHERDDAKDPGKLRGGPNDLCLQCHAETARDMRRLPFVHEAAKKDCTSCHNPHNSYYRKLLHRPPKELCTSCHTDIGRMIEQGQVTHAPVAKGNTCRNCHDAHAAPVQHLLKGLPRDLCMKCHGRDGLKANNGRPLPNLEKLLAANPKHHEPIDKKDCSACHSPHGGDNFRLLIEQYPESFYSAYSKKNFALCIKCHQEPAITTAKTSTRTGFRDGTRNLHYVHVNRPQRGRTCRACHGVHAASQIHLIRDDVPYGSSGWKLEVNYVKTEDGGRCTKTCHGAEEYSRK